MAYASNVNVSLQYNLNDYDDGDDDLYHVVVQKGNVGSSYVYALQLLHSQHNIYVFRGSRQKNVNFDKSNPVLRLIGQDGYTAGGHTQTWEYANQSGDWFVGTKPMPNQDNWTKQIARVHIPDGQKIYYNTNLQRLSYLNRAGESYGIGYSGDDMARVEAAVSPDYQYFMIASGDVYHNGYFSLYYLSDINSALNAAGTNPIDIRGIHCVRAFEIPGIAGANGSVGSLQGFDVSDGGNYIYISSQFAGDSDRKIVKIPWGNANPDSWETVDLNPQTILDANGYYTELEGIQLINDNDLYLTVAYHRDSDGLTAMNRIYRVNWTSNI